MSFQLVYASGHIDVIKNLMQFYMYDFSEYIDYDVEDDGFYTPYPDLDDYRNEGAGNFPFIIKKNEKYIGFALVKKHQSFEKYFSIAEFFIMKKHRRSGIGKAAAKQLFKLYQGDWQVRQRENNIPAQQFWRNVINDYTNGDFTERIEDKRTVQDFKSGKAE